MPSGLLGSQRSPDLVSVSRRGDNPVGPETAPGRLTDLHINHFGSVERSRKPEAIVVTIDVSHLQAAKRGRQSYRHSPCARPFPGVFDRTDSRDHNFADAL